MPAPGGVMDPRSLVPLEVAQQFADVVLQAPDTSHAAYRCTPRPAAQRRQFASASWPTPMPQAPLRTLQSANCLVGQVRVGRAKAAGRLQRVLKANRGMPPVKHDRG